MKLVLVLINKLEIYSLHLILHFNLFYLQYLYKKLNMSYLTDHMIRCVDNKLFHCIIQMLRKSVYP